MIQTKTRVRKSEKLTPDQHKAFKKWVARQLTKVDAAELLDIQRPTLERILIVGSGKPATIEKVLKQLTVAA